MTVIKRYIYFFFEEESYLNKYLINTTKKTLLSILDIETYRLQIKLGMNSYVLKWKRINDAIIQHKAQHFMKTETFLFQVNHNS